MITLCMDTSHIFLVLGLIRDGEVIASVQEKCWKRQSEEFFPKLTAMCEAAGITPDGIDALVISRGPGSYTGVRIAMTAAKVFCTMKDRPLYTLSTLQLYAGKESGRVLLDARGGRAYTCAYENGVPTEAESVRSVTEIDADTDIIGDGHLVSKEDRWPDIVKNFCLLQEQWQLSENAHLVVPEYLKPSDAYMVKK
ncbi:MAG: tRNA (adenosine(37)-N6)-threonylcarbamoyltransferase complex dimerization subunit type 1 TsaB [Solobacterium sp.]|nr:tRNA (adenosine(37)-N6)-threonylcarbamoyltransferase complex dimerization subunit type 1 TsaB [Solobacterium sp.]